ncbi:MAG TPA: acetate--CoA ligase family protein [Verrucomicrobiae bacterium]|nr:acetate--CoA ligase family protein [Verrucomicrobiae bacterium]
MTPAGSLAPFLNPASVAVIGASRDPFKVGGSVVANLRAAGFRGRVIPVNAHARNVQGLAAVPSLLDVDGAVDLAVIAVPAAGVLPVLEQCAAKRVGGVVVISAGFRETGGEGIQREADLRAWLRGRTVRVLGPNCLGWIRPACRLNVTFAPGMPEPGGIAFISHSGALAVAILDWARERRVGFSLFASLGNQADVNESDLLEAVAADPETRVIAGYLEGVADGQRFLDALGAAATVKPVVLLKTGRSPEGARAVSSHTGALAGSDRAFDAAVRRAGALRVDTVEELFDLARGLASQPLPRGRRLVVVTNGGGLGIVAADAARAAGLTMEPLGESVRRRLAEGLPSTASLGNPVDLVGDADARRYSHALHTLAGDQADAVLVLLTPQAATDSARVARTIAATTRGWPIPVVAAFVGGVRVAPGVRTLEEAGVPCYAFPEPAVKTLAGMARLSERRRVAPPMDRSADARATRAWLAGFGAQPGRLGMEELAPLLTDHGIPCVAARLAKSADDAAAVADAIGFPVALKIVSADITHKSEVGGVVLDLHDRAAVHRGAAAMLTRVMAVRPTAAVRGFLVQAMVADRGPELLLGGVRDPQFGPMVVVGFGGIYVEVLADTAARLAPVSPAEAQLMLDELRMAPVLAGVRGQPPVDRQALAGVVASFSQLLVDLPEMAEIEINPLIAGVGGAVAVDARARLAR